MLVFTAQLGTDSTCAPEGRVIHGMIEMKVLRRKSIPGWFNIYVHLTVLRY